jgi:hypothetical protein
MTRFRPTVEVLDARALPSAALAGSDDPTPAPVPQAAAEAQLADQPGTPATGDVANLSLN